MTIGIGGWGSRRKPMALVRAILRSGLTDLTIVSYGGPDVGLLIAAGQVRRVVCGFVTLDSIPLEPHFRLGRQAGTIELTELDEGMLHWGLLAAAHRLPFLPIRAGLGSDVLRVNPDLRTVRSPYADGEELVAMPALAARRRAHPPQPGRPAGQRPVPGPGPVLRRPVLRRRPTAASCPASGSCPPRTCGPRDRRRACWSTGRWSTAWSRRRAARTSPAACRTTAGTRRSRPSTRRRRRARRPGSASGPSTWLATRPLPGGRRALPGPESRGPRMSAGDATRAEVCVVACAEAWRGDGAILASPMGLIPALGARLAQLTFAPDLLLSDGEAYLLAPPDRPAQADSVVEGWLPYRAVFTVVAAGRRHVDDGRRAAGPARQPEHLLHRRLGPARRRSCSACAARPATPSTTRSATGCPGTRAGSSSRRSTWSAASATTGPRPPGRGARFHELRVVVTQPGRAGLPDPGAHHAAALGPSRGHGVRRGGQHRLPAGDPG